jgi:hypothetical protein
MNLGWQDYAALGIVFAAIAYLSRLAWGAFTRKAASGCATGCGNCSAQSSTAPGVRQGEPAEVVFIGGLGSTSAQGRGEHTKAE